jgi:hypothetical protein
VCVCVCVCARARVRVNGWGVRMSCFACVIPTYCEKYMLAYQTNFLGEIYSYSDIDKSIMCH